MALISLDDEPQVDNTEAPQGNLIDLDAPDEPQEDAAPEMTTGSVLRDVAAGALQIGPTAVKGVADIARLATGDRIGKDTSEAMDRGMGAIRDMVGSERAKVQRAKFEADMANDNVSIGDALLDNKGALADQVLPTIGSMFLPVGAAGAAGKLAGVGRAAQTMDKAAVAARVASAQKAAGIGASTAQNAASTFAELVDKGTPMEDAYVAAGITVPFSVVAGVVFGGGAEVAAARALTKTAAGKTGALQVAKATGKEGGQEVVEEVGQITGEAVATGETPSATAIGKQLAVAGTLGAVMGGGVDVASQLGSPVAAQLKEQTDKGNSPLSRATLAANPGLQTPADELAPNGAATPDATQSSEFFDAGAPNGLPGEPAQPIEPGLGDTAVDAAAGLGAGPGAVDGAATDTLRPPVDDLGAAAGLPDGAVDDPLRVAPGATLEGDPINKTWTAFHPESGTLNVPREQMPQVASEHRGAMTQYLKSRGVDHENDVVPADALKPTQDKFAPTKVKKALAFEGDDRAVLVSSDGYVLDGHHQWLAKAQQDAPVKVIRLNAPIVDLLKLMEAFPSAGMTKPKDSTTTETSDAQAEKTIETESGQQAPQATQVARTTVAAPQTVAAAPASATNTGTAQVRKRRAQLAHMAGRGFTQLEERDGVTYLVNPKQNAEMTLGSSIDVAWARQAVVAAGGKGDTVRQTTGVQNGQDIGAAGNGVGDQLHSNAGSRLSNGAGLSNAHLTQERGRHEPTGATSVSGQQNSKQPSVDDAVAQNPSLLARSALGIEESRKVYAKRLGKTKNPAEQAFWSGALSELPNLGTPNTAELRAFGAIKAAWSGTFAGHSVVAYHDTGPKAVDGFEQFGAVHINLAKPQMALQWTLGHEFEHATEKDQTPAQARLREFIWNGFTEQGKREFFEGFLKYPPGSYNAAMANPDQFTEQLSHLKKEMLAEFMGARFTDKAWLAQMAKQKPNLFGAFIKDWLAMLDNMIATLKSHVGIDQDSRKNVDKYLKDLKAAKAAALELAISWAEKNPGLAESTGADVVIQESKRAGAEQWRPRDNFLVPEIDGAFNTDTGNIALLPPLQLVNIDGKRMSYTAMPVRISIGQHGEQQDQFGVQHRLDNAKENRLKRGFITPDLGADGVAQVERATRDIALSVLQARLAFANRAVSGNVVLWGNGQSVVLHKTTDKQGQPYWSVKTTIPQSLEKVKAVNGNPTSINGITLDGAKTQQPDANLLRVLNLLKEPGTSPGVLDKSVLRNQTTTKGSIIGGAELQQSGTIAAGIPNQLQEPALGLSPSSSYTVSDLGLIVNQTANNGGDKTTFPKAKTPEEIAEARARMRAKLLKSKPEAIQRSARVALQDDAQAQEQWLQSEAQQQGYADIEELLTQNYNLFVALAKQWREQHPAEVLYSGRDDMDLDFMAELQAELDAELGGELGVSDAAIQEHGLQAENAFPELAFEKKSGNYQARIPDLYREGFMGVIQLESEADGLWGSQFNGTWIGPANTEKTGYATLKMAKAFARRFVASKELRERRFDLSNTVTPAQKNAVVQAWKSYNTLDDVRRYPVVNDTLPVKALAAKMGLTRNYDINVTTEVMDPTARTLMVEFVNRANGDVQAAVLELNKVDGQWLGTANTSSLSRGGLGAAFYQMMVEYAGARGITIHPDHSLSGVNTYRRTEQMLAAALRTGKSNVMVPHPTQRVYGFQNNASTPEEHDANLARLLLAGLRNVQELAPKADKLMYHPETGAFTDKKGKDQEAAVRKLLEDADARAFGLGRATLARAVLTRMAMSGEPVPATSFKEPVLYSARDTAELEYQAVLDQHQGTDMWLRAPNGAATNLTERQWVQVRTPSFLRWFGDWTQGNVWGRDDVSKVVDENNEPLVVYHGTDKGGFYKFQQPGGERRGDLGIFTTSNRDMASSYVRKGRAQDLTPAPMATREDLEEAGVSFDATEADVSRIGQDDAIELQHYWYDGYEHGPFDSEAQAVTDALKNFEPETQTKPGIYATFLNLRKPGEEDFEGALWSGERSHLWQVVVGDEPQESDGKIYFSEEEARALAKTFAAPDDEFEGADFMRAADDHWLTTDEAVRQARRMGNDSAIIRQVVDDGGGYSSYSEEPSDVFVAFDPGQIKSADFNTGEFGRADDIRYSTRVLQRQDVFEMDTRLPSVKNTGELLIADFASASKQVKWMASTAELMTAYPNYREVGPAQLPYQKLNRLINHMRDNLVWLYDQVPADIRERSKRWYEGGHALAQTMAGSYALTLPQASGIIATQSPQKDWFMNVDLARRIGKIMHQQQDFAWSPEMTQTAARIFAKEVYQPLVQEAMGKPLRALDELKIKAIWLRTFDETYNDRAFDILSPEGEVITKAVNNDGQLKKVAWGALPTIEKAISIYQNGSVENISLKLGGQHKVRNFYNNILLPDSLNGHVTIDTHAVAAALLRALTSNSPEVTHNFSSPKNAALGLKGTYAIYEEAYRRGAQELGILPRELQSITWEAVRGLFKPKFKAQQKNVDAVHAVWDKYKQRKLSHDNARESILEIAQGIESPSWLGPNAGIYVEPEFAADEGDVSGDELSGEPADTLDAGAGVGDPGAAAGLGAVQRSQRDGSGGHRGQADADLQRGATPSVAQGTNQSGASRSLSQATRITGAIHYGKTSGLSVLAGRSFGTGIKGAEQERLQSTADPRIKQRVYFYLPVEGGVPQPEIGLGGHVYQTDLDGLYDVTSGLVRGTGNAFESAILDAGYRGYINPEQGTVVVLGEDVPVKHIGGIGDFKVVQRRIERVIPKTVTRAEGDELVRKPEGQEMAQLANPKKQAKIREAAPSFRLEYGSIRVKATEADAADQAIAEFSPTFRFSELQKSARFNTPEVLPNSNTQDDQTANTKLTKITRDWHATTVVVPVKIEDTGEVASLTMPVVQTLDEFDERKANMQRLLECL